MLPLEPAYNPASMPSLRFNDVVKAYDGKVAVDGVSFEVHAGEVFGLLGPNGAGKTTLMRMAMDILRPDRGAIYVNDKPSTEADSDRIGYLPEERGLYRKQRVLDVLGYFGKLKGMPGGEARRKAREALEHMGLGEWGKKKVEELSKGMQQKVQLAATLLHDPEVIVLDEPFAGLDPVNTRLVKEIILEQKARGRLVVLSTHQMDQVEELCDRIAMIDRGRLVLYGALAEIKRRFASELRRDAARGEVVVVEGQGDFTTLPGVASWKRDGAGTALTLEPGLTPERFLGQALAAGLSITRFEAAPTPLEDIFVHVVTA